MYFRSAKNSITKSSARSEKGWTNELSAPVGSDLKMLYFSTATRPDRLRGGAGRGFGFILSRRKALSPAERQIRQLREKPPLRFKNSSFVVQMTDSPIKPF